MVTRMQLEISSNSLKLISTFIQCNFLFGSKTVKKDLDPSEKKQIVYQSNLKKQYHLSITG